MEYQLNSNNFEREVIESENPVLVDFWAGWCGPCKMIAGEIEKIAEKYQGKIKVGKVNIDEELALAEKYGIEVIPTLLLFKDGKVVNKLIGYNTAEEIEKIF